MKTKVTIEKSDVVPTQLTYREVCEREGVFQTQDIPTVRLVSMRFGGLSVQLIVDPQGVVEPALPKIWEAHHFIDTGETLEIHISK